MLKLRSKQVGQPSGQRLRESSQKMKAKGTKSLVTRVPKMILDLLFQIC